MADVQISQPGGQRNIEFLPGGKLLIQGLTLRDLVAGAWDLGDEYVSGGPPFVATEHYDIVAKAPGTAPEKDLRAMLKTLLLERFQLQVHTEQKPMPVYALVVSKKGQKLKPSAPEGKQECKLQLPAQRTDGLILRTYACKNTSMGTLAELLPNVAPAYANLPVIDLTELPGNYDFTLEWTPRGGVRATDGSTVGGAIPTTNEPDGKTLFDTLQANLGLRLEARKLPRDILVINKVQRVPTGN
ncbi:MAG: TIGR03435 family protein [Candidatus Solibacter sp.]